MALCGSPGQLRRSTFAAIEGLLVATAWSVAATCLQHPAPCPVRPGNSRPLPVAPRRRRSGSSAAAQPASRAAGHRGS